MTGHAIEMSESVGHVMRDAFGQAYRQQPAQRHETRIVLGGQSVRLRAVGDQLHQLVTRPFAHLQTEPSTTAPPPRLTIDLWDEAETGVGCAGCHIDDDRDLHGQITCSDDGRYVGYRRARSVTLYDRQDRRMLGWSAYEDQALLYEMGRPLHVLLSYWHRDAGLQLMHSALVALDGCGVLFPGLGGSGKSTSALSCLEAGWHYLGDDYISLSCTSDGTFMGHSVYSSTHVEPDHLDRFKRLRSHAIPARHEQEDKSLVLLNELYPEQFLASAPICAIALPRVCGAAESSYEPATKGQALLALAPSSMVMVPGRNAQTMEQLAQLVEHTPCYWMHLGHCLESIAPCVESIVKEVTA